MTNMLQVGDIVSVQYRDDAHPFTGTVEAVSDSPEHVAPGCRYAVLVRHNVPYAMAQWACIGGSTKVELVERPTPPQPQDATTADVQAAWEAFCSVPSYVGRDMSAEPFDAVAIARRLTLARARHESADMLARIERETQDALAAEMSAGAKSGGGIEYIPDGGGEVRRTRSGAWLAELD